MKKIAPGVIMKIPPYLVNEHYDDRYFDVVNAIEEAKHIFFQGTGIMDILSPADFRVELIVFKQV